MSRAAIPSCYEPADWRISHHTVITSQQDQWTLRPTRSVDRLSAVIGSVVDVHILAPCPWSHSISLSTYSKPIPAAVPCARLDLHDRQYNQRHLYGRLRCDVVLGRLGAFRKRTVVWVSCYQFSEQQLQSLICAGSCWTRDGHSPFRARCKLFAEFDTRELWSQCILWSRGRFSGKHRKYRHHRIPLER